MFIIVEVNAGFGCGIGLRDRNNALSASSVTTLMFVSSTTSTGEWILVIRFAAKNPSFRLGMTCSTMFGSIIGSSR